MLKSLVLILVSLLAAARTFGADIDLLANNKEVESRLLGRQEKKDIAVWIRKFSSEAEALENAKSVLERTLEVFSERNASCDLGFLELLRKTAESHGLVSGEKEFTSFLSFLRSSNRIDDLLLNNLRKSYDLAAALKSTSVKKLPKAPKLSAEEGAINVEELYAGFRTWPDEISLCSLGTYFSVARGLSWKDSKERDRLLRKTNRLALDRGIISEESFRKLEVLRKRKALDWPIYIVGYLDVVSNAKDKLSPTGKPELDPSSNSTKYAARKRKLTRRGRLYQNFTSSQVMMLAQVIQKTSWRMDAHSVEINFRYRPGPDSDGETYVLSPMERYRLSIKMLRKDMGEIMRSDLFAGTSVEYGDLVTAAYETGLIRSEELDLILKFEDFWNPKVPKWKVYANFTFSILGTASFYLPPPWNIVAAIALVVTQTQIDQKSQKPDEDDNWNVVI